MKTNLIHKKAVRDLALKVSKDIRLGKFTRVADSFFMDIEMDVRALITRRVRSHPSLGKTLRGSYMGYVKGIIDENT